MRPIPPQLASAHFGKRKKTLYFNNIVVDFEKQGNTTDFTRMSLW